MAVDYLFVANLDDTGVRNALDRIDAKVNEIARNANSVFSSIGTDAVGNFNKVKDATQENISTFKTATNEVKALRNEIKGLVGDARQIQPISVSSAGRSSTPNTSYQRQEIQNLERRNQLLGQIEQAEIRSQQRAGQGALAYIKNFPKVEQSIRRLIRQYGQLDIQLDRNGRALNEQSEQFLRVIGRSNKLEKEIKGLAREFGGLRTRVSSLDVSSPFKTGTSGALTFAKSLGKAGVFGAVLGVTLGLQNLAQEASRTFQSMIRDASSVADEFQITRLSFEGIFSGDTEQATALFEEVRRLSRYFGSDVGNLAVSLAPFLENTDQLAQAAEIATELSLLPTSIQQGQDVGDAVVALIELASGEPRSLQKRFEIAPIETGRIKDAIDELGLGAGLEELEKVLQSRGSDFAKFEGTVKIASDRLREYSRDLLSVMGASINEKIIDFFENIFNFIADNEDALNEVSATFGELVGIILSIPFDFAEEKFFDLDNLEKFRQFLEDAIDKVEDFREKFEEAQPKIEANLLTLETILDTIGLIVSRTGDWVGELGKALGIALALPAEILLGIQDPGTIGQDDVDLAEVWDRFGKVSSIVLAEQRAQDAAKNILLEAVDEGRLSEDLRSTIKSAPVALNREDLLSDSNLSFDEKEAVAFLTRIPDYTEAIDVEDLLKFIPTLDRIGGEYANIGRDLREVFGIIPDTVSTETEEGEAPRTTQILPGGTDEVSEEEARKLEDVLKKRLEIEKKFADEQIKLEIQNAQKIESIEQQHSDKLEDILQDFYDKRDDLIEKFQDKLEDIEGDFNEDQIKAEKDATDKRAEIWRDYYRKLEDLRRQFDFDASEAIRQNDAIRFLQLRRRLQFDQNEARVARDRDLEDVKADEDKKNQELKDKRQKALDDAQKDLERGLRDAQTAYERNLRDANEARERDLRDLKAYNEQKLEEILSSYDEELKEFDSFVAEKEEDLLGYLNNELALISEKNNMIANTEAEIYQKRIANFSQFIDDYGIEMTKLEVRFDKLNQVFTSYTPPDFDDTSVPGSTPFEQPESDREYQKRLRDQAIAVYNFKNPNPDSNFIKGLSDYSIPELISFIKSAGITPLTRRVSVKARKMGGSVIGGNTYLVGEAGPELLQVGQGFNGRIKPIADPNNFTIPGYQIGATSVNNSKNYTVDLSMLDPNALSPGQIAQITAIVQQVLLQATT